MNINEYAIKLISDKRFLRHQYAQYVDDNYELKNVSGVINPRNLSKVIHRAKYSIAIRNMLSDILLYADKTSITDANFRMLLRFRPKWRNTYLSNLGHCELAFYQMQILNRYPLALEAFSWLFDQICHYDFFSEEDMAQILRDNPDIQKIAIEECIDRAYSLYGGSAKLEVAIKWVGMTS